MPDNSRVQTLSHFIRYGYTSSYSIQAISLFYKDGDIIYLDQPVYQKYDRLVMAMAQVVELTDEELNKYKYSPELLSYDLYGTPNLSHLILYINRCPAYSFNRKNIKLIKPNYIETVLQKIIQHEQNNITKNHNQTI